MARPPSLLATVLVVAAAAVLLATTTTVPSASALPLTRRLQAASAQLHARRDAAATATVRAHTAVGNDFPVVVVTPGVGKAKATLSLDPNCVKDMQVTSAGKKYRVEAVLTTGCGKGRDEPGLQVETTGNTRKLENIAISVLARTGATCGAMDERLVKRITKLVVPGLPEDLSAPTEFYRRFVLVQQQNCARDEHRPKLVSHGVIEFSNECHFVDQRKQRFGDAQTLAGHLIVATSCGLSAVHARAFRFVAPLAPYALLPTASEQNALYALLAQHHDNEAVGVQLLQMVVAPEKLQLLVHHALELLLIDAKQVVLHSLHDEDVALGVLHRWTTTEGVKLAQLGADDTIALSTDPQDKKDHVVSVAFHNKCWTPIAKVALATIDTLHKGKAISEEVYTLLMAGLTDSTEAWDTTYRAVRCDTPGLCTLLEAEGWLQTAGGYHADFTSADTKTKAAAFNPEFHALRNERATTLFVHVLSLLVVQPVVDKAPFTVSANLAVRALESSLALAIHASVDYLALWRAQHNWSPAFGSTPRVLRLVAALEALLNDPRLLRAIAMDVVAAMGHVDGIDGKVDPKLDALPPPPDRRDPFPPFN